MTRHGQAVAVVVGVAEFERMSRPRPDFRDYLLDGPVVEVDLVRAPDLPREVDPGDQG